MHDSIRKLNWILGNQFGLDVRRMVRSASGVPRFVADYINFRKKYSGRIRFFPCLYDWGEPSGSIGTEYFKQDLYFAQQIYKANPCRHVDIGSRMDGFVAHLASYRSVEVFDIRPIGDEIPGILFRQADVMKESPDYSDYTDSLSCLHALEHFGLGRYGDEVDPLGYEKGLRNMARMLKREGLFYLSVPIGLECVEFNAHRIFDPLALVNLAGKLRLNLEKFSCIYSGNIIHGDSEDPRVLIEDMAKKKYALGMFTFKKESGCD